MPEEDAFDEHAEGQDAASEEMTVGAERGLTWGALGASFLGLALPLWPLWGNPPYGYYTPMKWGLAGFAAFVTYVLVRFRPKTAPLGFLMLFLGGLHLFGKFTREDWVPFNWAAVTIFLVAAFLLWVRCTQLEEKVSGVTGNEGVPGKVLEGLGCLTIAGFIVGLFILQSEGPKEETPPADKFASKVSGSYESATRPIDLTLDDEERTATLTIYDGDGESRELRGTWTNTASTITLTFDGEGRAWSNTYGLVEGASFFILAPTPAAEAPLGKCFLQWIPPD